MAAAYGLSDKTYRFQIVSLVGLVVIGTLLLLLHQQWANRVSLRPPKLKGVADRAVFETYARARIDELNVKLKQLSFGNILLTGKEVLDAQLFLINALMTNRNVAGKNLFAADLTKKPDLLQTRSAYHRKNKEFIQEGGRIRRVFIVDTNDLAAASFRTSLLALAAEHESIGVDVGVQLLDMIGAPRLRQDFIVYDKIGVIHEGQQAAPDYSDGHSHLYFSTVHVDEFEAIFNKLWQGEHGAGAKKIYLLLKRYAEQLETSKVQFDAKYFQGSL
jgi:hypothetical protein